MAETIGTKLAALAQQPGASDAAEKAESLAELVVDVAHKDGIKTTEFWLTLLVVIFGMGLTGYEVYSGKLDLAGAVVWLSTIGGVAKYLHDRAAIKIAATAAKGFVLAALLLFGSGTLSGCTAAQIETARSDFHAVTAGALGLVAAAQANPELVEEAKAGLNALAQRASDPKDAAAIGAALDHVNAGNLDKAQATLAPLVAASSKPAAGP